MKRGEINAVIDNQTNSSDNVPVFMVHKGEVNSLIEGYNPKQSYLIFSAKTSSGNSGSPLINLRGAVIGIVSEEFFDQDAFKDRGKPPYYAALPMSVVTGFNIPDESQTLV